MKLAVLTAAVFESEEVARKKLWIFLASCEKFGVMPYLHMYGIGRGFPGYKVMKLEMQLEYLKSIASTHTHVLYTDSWDAFFVADLDEAIEKYESMGAPPILSSAYFGLGNESDMSKYEGMFDPNVHYRYPNVGGHMSEIPAIIEAFERMLKMPEQSGDDCFNWYGGWREGWFRPKLDSECEIFQVTEENCVVDGNKNNPILVNEYTAETPVVLHLSGGYTDPVTGKDERMIPWAKKLWVIE